MKILFNVSKKEMKAVVEAVVKIAKFQTKACERDSETKAIMTRLDKMDSTLEEMKTKRNEKYREFERDIEKLKVWQENKDCMEADPAFINGGKVQKV